MKYELIVMCSAALASAAAFAEDTNHSRGSADLFTTLDVDSDGKVSKEEAAANRSFTSNFSALDKNSDGFVSKSEFHRNTIPKADR